MRINKHYFTPLIAVALFVTATAQAAVHRVYPGDSIQAAIDIAQSGDTIIVEPGVYKERNNGLYGLRITQDNLRLIGKVREKKGQGKPNKVRLLATKGQETGVYAAPDGCEYFMDAEDKGNGDPGCKTVLGLEYDGPIQVADYVKGFYIRGFSVEGFPVNGIQTRWVDGFEFAHNDSVDNLNNGIYPTLSANGMVRNNVSYGSLDTAMWVAGSESVRVIGNELYGSVIGFEITVSNNVEVTANKIYDNTVGVGLFHPNGAGNPPLPVMANWVIEHNDIYDNNRPNEAVEGTFQSVLPPGIGVLLSGVSDHRVVKNNVEDNDYVGIAVLGWCTGLEIEPEKCIFYEEGDDRNTLRGAPQANDNLISQNYLRGNAGVLEPPPGGGFPPADLVYAQVVEQFVPGAPSSGNCFEDNKPENDFTAFSIPPFNDGNGSTDPSDLPSDC